MSALGRPPVLLDIVEEHFDELDFLWEHRETNLFTPDWTLADLAEHEERAEAHLDGLRLAELHAVELAEPHLLGEQTFAATAAALVLFETGDEDLRDRIRRALREASIEAFHGIRIALRHCPIDDFVEALRSIADATDPVRRAGALDVLAFHHMHVNSLNGALRAKDALSRALALGAAGRLGRLSPEDLSAALDDPEPPVRRQALDAAAKMGMRQLAPLCRAAASRETDPDPVAVAFLGVLGDASDLTVLHGLLTRPELSAAVVDALGAMGRVEAVPLLLDLMADDELGVAATRAYRRITAAPDIEGQKPFPPPEVPEGEDEDEALPPDPVQARADWERRSRQITPEVRWQSGFPIPVGELPPAFDALPLESRRDVYLQLRAFGSAVPDLELEALAHRQVVAA